jgi:8-oxo-dGTP diphosphatase
VAKDVKTVLACGVVPWRRRVNGDIEVLLIHRPRYDDWSMPKGKLDDGETEEQCAVREMFEETGVRGELGEPLPTALYTDHRGRPKEVSYWLMEVPSGPVGFEANEEVDRLGWFSIAQANELLTYEIDQGLLDEALLVLAMAPSRPEGSL